MIPNINDIHQGETCVIIGNGPSLKDVPLEFLVMYPTFACNQIRLMEDFEPWYFSVVGSVMLETQEKRDLLRPSIEGAKIAFVNRLYTEYATESIHQAMISRFKHYLDGSHEVFSGDNIFPVLGDYALLLDDDEYVMEGQLPYRKWFSLNPYKAVGIGYTQTYVNLQLAFCMGFHTALMVGIDHDFGNRNRHFYKDAEAGPHQSEVRKEHEAYKFAEGADRVYELSRRVYEGSDRRILNLTPNSKATAFDVDLLENWL